MNAQYIELTDVYHDIINEDPKVIPKIINSVYVTCPLYQYHVLTFAASFGNEYIMSSLLSHLPTPDHNIRREMVRKSATYRKKTLCLYLLDKFQPDDHLQTAFDAAVSSGSTGLVSILYTKRPMSPDINSLRVAYESKQYDTVLYLISENVDIMFNYMTLERSSVKLFEFGFHRLQQVLYYFQLYKKSTNNLTRQISYLASINESPKRQFLLYKFIHQDQIPLLIKKIIPKAFELRDLAFLPLPLLIEILEHSSVTAELLPYHYKWNLLFKIKHHPL